jgi:hypothetical protein
MRVGDSENDFGVGAEWRLALSVDVGQDLVEVGPLELTDWALKFVRAQRFGCAKSFGRFMVLVADCQHDCLRVRESFQETQGDVWFVVAWLRVVHHAASPIFNTIRTKFFKHGLYGAVYAALITLSAETATDREYHANGVTVWAGLVDATTSEGKDNG